jgi:hypothetical protein
MRRRAGPGLANARVEPQVADKLALPAEAARVTDRRDKGAATITFTPGTVISRLTSGQSSASSAISRSTSAISQSKNSIWRRPLSIVSRSSNGSSSSLSQRRPATPNRSLKPGRATSRRISAACTSFFTRVRARTSCERRANRRRIARVR